MWDDDADGYSGGEYEFEDRGGHWHDDFEDEIQDYLLSELDDDEDDNDSLTEDEGEEDEEEDDEDKDENDNLASLKRPRSSTHVTPPPSSNLALLVFDSAAAPRHRVFDAKYLDADVLLLVLRDWVGSDSSNADMDPAVADRTAISLSLVDARFFTSLYHHYHVQQQRTIVVLYRAFRRRFARAAAASREASSDGRRGADPQQNDVDNLSASWFLPRFRRVTGHSAKWSNSLIERAKWLLDRVESKILIFRAGEIVRSRLPVTQLFVAEEDFGEQRCSRLASSLKILPDVTSFEALDCRTADESCDQKSVTKLFARCSPRAPTRDDHPVHSHPQ